MKKFTLIVGIFFLSLLLTQCSNDDGASGPLFVNGRNFPLGNNSDTEFYNMLVDDGASSGQTFLIITEKIKNDGDARFIFIYANHTGTASASGTYALSTDYNDPGKATVLYNTDLDESNIGTFSAGGTLTIAEDGNRNYKITFNNVVLDAGKSRESKITGHCSKKFTLAVFADDQQRKSAR